MFDPNQRSKAFNFALKAQQNFGLTMGVFVLWSIWAIFFSNIEYIFISKVLLTFISIGFALITPLIDFNESHATNPLWTGHARFHLVWQVNAMIFSSFLSLYLIWFIGDMFSLGLVFCIIYLWVISFALTMISMPFYDGELNDINGVPPIRNNFFGKTIEIDRNVQAISGVFVLSTYSLILVLI
tara:strand:+ start:1955 stop:2506 length:552 start_codon:yes stop_codon:yes gene_type:complete